MSELEQQSQTQVVYVFDAYCGWCYGFGATVQHFWDLNRNRVGFSAISGGLFLGERRLPISTFGFIEAANARLTEVTGAEFGEPYQHVLRDGSLVMDSEAAAAGFAALRDQAPERSIEIANAVQRSFFRGGRSLSDVQTFTDLARAYHLDADRVERFIAGPDGRAAAMHDFSLARALGANAFPTLLVMTDHAVIKLGGVGTSAETLTRQLDRAIEIAAEQSPRSRIA